MTYLRETAHGSTRMAERALSAADIDLVVLFGTEVDDGYLLRAEDCQAAIRELKVIAERVGRLAQARVVAREGVLVTAYRATKKQMARLARDKGNKRRAKCH